MKHISTFNCNRPRTSPLMYTVFVIAGIFIGAVLSIKTNAAQSVWINQCFLPLHSDGNYIFMMRNAFVMAALFLSAAFFFGLSALGQPFGLLLLVYRGIGIGASSAVMYALFGRKAAFPVAVIMLPNALAVSAVSVLAVREMMRNSRMLLNLCIGRECSTDNERILRLYIIKFIVLMFMSLFISAADGLISYLYYSVIRR